MGYDVISRNPLNLLVGATGLEPATPCTPCKCATRLRYAPTQGMHLIRPLWRCHANSTPSIVPSGAAEIVLDPFDVVLPEVFAPLYLDEDQRGSARVLNPVDRAQRGVQGDSLPHGAPF